MNMNSKSMHRILLIDDQETIHDDYRKILGPRQQSPAALDQAAADLFGDDSVDTITWEGFELDSALQGEEGFNLVRQSFDEGRPYAMAFVDIRMPPGWDGVQTVRRIWEVDPEILIVICSAYSDYSWEDMVSQLGRNDRFLILKKPFDNIEVRQCAMVLTERWSVSRTDVLTGLLNRRAFQGHATLEWSRSKRHELRVACALLDLDFFKHINDEFGHTAGDVVLKIVARQLQKQCRTSDSVCRYGGEEFCVLLPHTDEEGAASWAEFARQAIEAMPVTINDRSLQVTASFGVAERLADDDRIELLIERADQALMVAKRAGRNRVMRSTTALSAQRIEQTTVEHDPLARTTRTQLIQSAQAITRGAAELAEIICSPVDDPAPSAIERISRLKELIRNLLSNLQRPIAPPIINLDSSIQSADLNVQSTIGN
jgi:diguanylate cyclase (GGDEF)-like protein